MSDLYSHIYIIYGSEFTLIINMHTIYIIWQIHFTDYIPCDIICRFCKITFICNEFKQIIVEP